MINEAELLVSNLHQPALDRNQRRRLHQGVADSLSVDILTGAIIVGQALPADPVLSARYGVSRTVIREAIQAQPPAASSTCAKGPAPTSAITAAGS